MTQLRPYAAKYIFFFFKEKGFCPAWTRTMERFLQHLEFSWLQWRNSLWKVSEFSRSCLHIVVNRLWEEAAVSGTKRLWMTQVQHCSSTMGSKSQPTDYSTCLNFPAVGTKLFRYQLRDGTLTDPCWFLTVRSLPWSLRWSWSNSGSQGAVTSELAV